MDLELNGRVAVVTGGASGIGRATAAAFLAEGARIALWDLPNRLEQTVAKLRQETGGEIVGVACDVSQEDAVGKAVEQTLSAFGSIDHLVHAAAIGSGKFGFPFTNLAPADWQRVLNVNIMGMVHIAHAVGPVMQVRRSGTMVFVASVAGQIGSQTDPPYSATKAANINFAQCLAKDLAPHNVRVNTVCPGMVQTPLNRAVWQAWHDQQPPDRRRSYEDWADEKVRTVVPLGRWQQPTDIGAMIVFLSSPRASEVTGQTINVDGGFVMHW
ncbi:MAG TPA: SDR family oxidoreductase [Planctomycetaceae bacterium]|nr:SDR family oxidoreductase [Planctomycetaceae bacterium]